MKNDSFHIMNNIVSGRPSEIPKIIHQTWKDDNIPERYLNFQESWSKYLPDWEYCLWTDCDCRNFLAKYYDWFLPIYDSYPKPIMRVDAVRYFWMYHFGGLYIDLDFEALKSIEPLLENQKVVIGLEPEDHLQRKFSLENGFEKILCNALMASVPKAPLWLFIIEQLKKHQLEADPLVATGPFFLTKGYNMYENKSEVTLIPSKYLYPIVEGVENNNRPTEAYAIHHWEGSWWRHLLKKPTTIDKLVERFSSQFPKVYSSWRNVKSRFFN